MSVAFLLLSRFKLPQHCKSSILHAHYFVAGQTDYLGYSFLMANLNHSLFQVSTSRGMLGESRKVLGLSDKLYHSDVHIQSCSLLKRMLQSPADYCLALSEEHASTDSMDFGTLVHLLVLQPHLLFAQVATYPGVYDGRKTDYKEFVAKHPGMLVVDEPTMHLAEMARDKLLDQMVMGRRFGDFVVEGEKEVCVYYTDPSTGVECRTRHDLLHPEAIFDVKTALCADLKPWTKQLLTLSYDMQAYMYSLSDCLYSGRNNPLPFIFMGVENGRRLSTFARRAGVSVLQEGASKYQRAISAFAACEKVDYWPAPGGEETIELEFWQVNQRDPLSWLPGAQA